MCQHQFKLSSPDALRKSIGKLLFTSEKSISWVKRFEKLRKVSKKKKKPEKEREKEKVIQAEREREREREEEKKKKKKKKKMKMK